jgi:hypothetical protein
MQMPGAYEDATLLARYFFVNVLAKACCQQQLHQEPSHVEWLPLLKHAAIAMY